MIDAKDVERTFRTWLDLARDEEVLVLFALVQAALEHRGYTARCQWAKLSEKTKMKQGGLVFAAGDHARPGLSGFPSFRHNAQNARITSSCRAGGSQAGAARPPG